MHYDVIVIGGGPAGIQAALSARYHYPEKSVALIHEGHRAMLPYGIAYILRTQKVEDSNFLPEEILKRNGIKVIISDVSDCNDKTLILTNGQNVDFEKLVMATGSIPNHPTFPGVGKKRVFTIDNLPFCWRKILDAERILIANTGYLGIDLANELTDSGKLVTIIEPDLPTLLPSIDDEFSQIVEEELRRIGCAVYVGTHINRFVGDDTVTGAILANDELIKTDCVILGVDHHPDLMLLPKFGIKFDGKYGITVDEYMRTSKNDIFAVGSCVATKRRFSCKYTSECLISTAIIQGQIAGANLFRIKPEYTFQGSLGTHIIKIGDNILGVTGLTEKEAHLKCIDHIVGTTELKTKKNLKFLSSQEPNLKLIFSRDSHVLLGAQAFGDISIAELVNLLSVMIKNGMTDAMIESLEIGFHPRLTTGTATHPVINATKNAIEKAKLIKRHGESQSELYKESHLLAS